MDKKYRKTVVLSIIVVVCLSGSGIIYSNGGPFIVKYPDGDTAAKGILAKLEPDLKPRRETQLKVIEENLSIIFGQDRFPVDSNSLPLVGVTAQYKIENPTDKEIQIDFGFPILRGIYMNPLSMIMMPDVEVLLDNTHLPSTIISNSAIYGLIRQRSRAIIDKAIADDTELAGLTAKVRNPAKETKEQTRQEIISYLTASKKWNERDASLFVEYASLDFGQIKAYPADRGNSGWVSDAELQNIINQNLGALGAIGEQKATQFFAQLAGCFDKNALTGYEEIFKAWGGDVREMAIDIKTGQMRPRELAITKTDVVKKTDAKIIPRGEIYDPAAIYARVDYFDENAKISEAEKASCKSILKNLPVVFTFAPMNILHYQAKFPAKSTLTLSVSYNQYAFIDTKEPHSYQLAYVLHPASLWDEFGPINIKVSVPAGSQIRSSVPLAKEINRQSISLSGRISLSINTQGKEFDVYKQTTKEKNGELFIAVDSGSWNKAIKAVSVAATGQKSLSITK